jgi:hypothetical protein
MRFFQNVRPDCVTHVMNALLELLLLCRQMLLLLRQTDLLLFDLLGLFRERINVMLDLLERL